MTRHPRLSRRSLTLMIAAPFLVVACGTAANDESATGEATSSTASTTEIASEAPDSATTAADTWRDIELTDAASGETFTLASLAGDVVAVEPMAIWCTSCKRQQDNVRAAYDDLEAAGVRFISLGVEPNEQASSLAKYAKRHDYGWTFAQSPIELSRALNDIFGPQILAPPSTPLIVLDETGEIVFQDYGSHSPDSLVEIMDEAAA